MFILIPVLICWSVLYSHHSCKTSVDVARADVKSNDATVNASAVTMAFHRNEVQRPQTLILIIVMRYPV